MQKTFEEHGDYLLSVTSNILTIRASGAWNKEKSLAYSADCKKLINQQFTDDYFLVLLITQDWLPTHDSIEILQEVTHWSLKRGLRAEAFCFSNMLEAEVITKMITPHISDHFDRESFDDEASALEWLTSIIDSDTQDRNSKSAQM